MFFVVAEVPKSKAAAYTVNFRPEGYIVAIFAVGYMYAIQQFLYGALVFGLRLYHYIYLNLVAVPGVYLYLAILIRQPYPVIAVNRVAFTIGF